MTNPTFFLHSPLDMHIHFREGDMLRRVAPLSARTFAGGVIMPNLVPPVDNFGRLERYAAEVRTAVAGHDFEPYMTLFMRSYTERELASMKDRIIGVKLYPEGVTTHSDTGVGNLRDVEDTLARMEDMGIRLLVHGETSDFVLDRERAFLPVYEDLAARFPRLDIVMEHITTREAAALLDRHENLYATVTLQHLLITLDDVAGGLLNPHLFCKPIAKRPEDRDALLARALEAHPKLAFRQRFRAAPGRQERMRRLCRRDLQPRLWPFRCSSDSSKNTARLTGCRTSSRTTRNGSTASRRRRKPWCSKKPGRSYRSGMATLSPCIPEGNWTGRWRTCVSPVQAGGATCSNPGGATYSTRIAFDMIQSL